MADFQICNSYSHALIVHMSKSALLDYGQSLFFRLSSATHGKDTAKAGARKLGRRLSRVDEIVSARRLNILNVHPNVIET